MVLDAGWSHQNLVQSSLWWQRHLFSSFLLETLWHDLIALRWALLPLHKAVPVLWWALQALTACQSAFKLCLPRRCILNCRYNPTQHTLKLVAGQLPKQLSVALFPHPPLSRCKQSSACPATTVQWSRFWLSLQPLTNFDNLFHTQILLSLTTPDELLDSPTK